MSYEIYVFDAYGTLFDVHAAVARHAQAIGPQAARLSELWRTKQLEYTWVRTLAGAYRDFRAVTEDALHFAAAQCGGVSPEVFDALLKAYETLDAYPDAKPALQALRARGAKTAILSNGTPAMLASAVEAAGLSDVLDEVISVDALRLYKTAPLAYQLAADRFRVGDRASISFQSSNRWDIAGAARFGFRPVWINRTGQPDEYADLPPAHILRGLHELPLLDA